jgi:hypothetical protein
MWMVLWNVGTGAVGLLANLLSIRSYLSNGNTSSTIELQKIAPPAIVDVYVGGNMNGVSFSTCGGGYIPPQLSICGNCLQVPIGLPTNTNARVYVSGNCNEVSIPWHVRSRVHVVLGGNCNRVV